MNEQLQNHAVDPTLFQDSDLAFNPEHQRITVALDRIGELAELGQTDSETSPLHGLAEDFEDYTQNPDKLARLAGALGEWGNSPFMDGSKGEDGKGTHAGLEHFFAYRLDAKKGARWGKDGMNLPPTLDAFVELSEALGGSVNDPSQSEQVQAAFDMADGVGNVRRIGNYGDNLFIAFKRADGDEKFRVSSMFDSKGAAEKAEKTVIRDSEGFDPSKEAGKINQLASKPEVTRVK